MPNIANQLADFAADLTLSDVPADVLARAKCVILDGIGCGLFGANLEWARILSRVVGRPDAQVGPASITQNMVPLAADFARPEQRGRAVGVVFSGILAGILLARALSGAVAAALGWRPMFLVASVLGLGLASVSSRRASPGAGSTATVPGPACSAVSSVASGPMPSSRWTSRCEA